MVPPRDATQPPSLPTSERWRPTTPTDLSVTPTVRTMRARRVQSRGAPPGLLATRASIAQRVLHRPVTPVRYPDRPTSRAPHQLQQPQVSPQPSLSRYETCVFRLRGGHGQAVRVQAICGPGSRCPAVVVSGHEVSPVADSGAPPRRWLSIRITSDGALARRVRLAARGGGHYRLNELGSSRSAGRSPPISPATVVRAARNPTISSMTAVDVQTLVSLVGSASSP